MNLAGDLQQARAWSRVRADMAEIPTVVCRLLGTRPGLFDALRRAPHPPAGIVLLACGSSEHAARYGASLLERTTAQPVSLLSTAESIGSDDFHGFIAVGLSRSGETEDVVSGLAAFRRAGALAIGVTARRVSPVAATSDVVIDLCTEHEESGLATTTVVASLTAMGLLADVLAGGSWSTADWLRLVSSLEAVLDDADASQRAASLLRPTDSPVCLGRDLLHPIAAEAAWALATAANMPAQARASMPFGPDAPVGPGRPVIGFASLGPAGDETRHELDRAGLMSRVLLVDQSPPSDVSLPGGVRPALIPITAAVRAHQIALASALQRTGAQSFPD